MIAESLLVAAGGVAGDRRRLHHRRGHLYDLVRVAETLSRAEERPVRELARTLRSEAERALTCRRMSWLHTAVASLAIDLARELVPRPQAPALPELDERRVVPTSRCAVCGAVIAARRIMCYADWSQVPRGLQRALVDADAETRPRLMSKALAAVEAASGRVPKRKRRKKPAEFFNRPSARG